MSANPQRYLVNGTAQATTASKTGTVIAAVTGKTFYMQRGILSVTTAATGAGGIVKICDGTTKIMQWDANAVKDYYFDFGDIGYPLTAGNAFQVIVSGAGTNDATCDCAAVGYRLGD